MTLDSYRPTLDEVKQYRDSLEGQWNAGRQGGLVNRQQDEEDIYFQRFPLAKMANESAVRVGSAPSDVNSAIDVLVPHDMVVRCEPARDKQKYQKQADLLIRAGRSFLRQWRQHRDVLRFVAADQCLRSYGVGRVLYDDRLWPERPADAALEDPEALEAWEIQKRGKCPITLEWRNARYVRWMEDDHGKPLVVVESYPTTVLQAQRTFGHFPKAKAILRALRHDLIVQVDDVWFGQYRCVLIDQQAIFPVNPGTRYAGVAPHVYPEIPYIFAPFRELPFDVPVERYRGVLTEQMTVYPAESQAVTMHVTMLRLNAWRTYVGWTKDKRQLQIIPGEVTPLDKRFGEYLELLQGQSVPPEVLQTASMLSEYRLQNGVGQTGVRTQDGARSAQQVMAQQALSEKKIQSARDGLQRFCAEAIRLACIIVEHVIREPIVLPSPGRDRNTGKWLGEVQLSPEAINGYVDRFEVSFSRRVDPAQLEQAKALMALSQGNWMPWSTSVELSGFCDTPQDWHDLLLVQAAERQPFIMELAGYKMVKAYFGDDAEDGWIVDVYRARLEQQKAQEQQQAGPGVPNPGASTAPNTLKGLGAGVQQQAHQGPMSHRRGNQGGAGRPPRPGGGQGGG